jgi:hypothetical protein
MRWRETLAGPSSRKFPALTVQDETIFVTGSVCETSAGAAQQENV